MSRSLRRVLTLASGLATILAMVMGFTAVMLTALAIYLVGITCLRRIA